MGPELPKGIKSCNLKNTGRSSAWKSTAFGTLGSQVQILSSRLFFEDPKFAWCPYRCPSLSI